MGLGVDKEGEQFSQRHLEPKAELRPKCKSQLPHPCSPVDDQRLLYPSLPLFPSFCTRSWEKSGYRMNW